jgi:hypothetical protein
MGASVRGKPPNALRTKGVEKEEEEEVKDHNYTATLFSRNNSAAVL